MNIINISNLKEYDSVYVKELFKKVNHDEDLEIVFNKNIKYVDSNSIGSLLYMKFHLNKKNKKLYLSNCSDDLKQVFLSLLLDKYLIIKE